MRRSKPIVFTLGILLSIASVGCCHMHRSAMKDACCAPGAKKEPATNFNAGSSCCAPGASTKQGM